MKKAFLWLVLGISSWAVWAADAAPGPLVTRILGLVTIAAANGKAEPVKAFSKLRPGDRVVLANGAKLRLVYTNGGRQETWNDAATINIGSSESKLEGGGRAPDVATLPPYLVQTLSMSPVVLADIQSRQGMVRLRALPSDTRLAKTWKEYDELRRMVADDDIGPELHLLVKLQELKAFSDMKEVLAEMLRRQPDNTEVKALNERYIAPAAPKS